MNTSLILSGEEWASIVKLNAGNTAEPLLQLLKNMNACDENIDKIQISLQEKQLAKLEGNLLRLSPLLHLIVTEAKIATSICEPSSGCYVLECPALFLLFTRYEWAQEMWRISAFQDMDSLQKALFIPKNDPFVKND